MMNPNIKILMGIWNIQRKMVLNIQVNGDVYEGDFVDGKLNGRGKYTFANDDDF